MKVIFTIIILLAVCFSVSAQSVVTGSGDVGRFQSVSGDFGRTWINNFMAQNQKPAEKNLSNDLWNWGSSPRGKQLVGGKLVDIPQYLTPQVNFSANWLGDISRAPPLYLNGSSPYGIYGTTNGNLNSAPLTPLALSDDSWVLAQQLDRPVAFKASDYYDSTFINNGYRA